MVMLILRQTIKQENKGAMKVKGLKEKTKDELETVLKERREKLRQLRFDLVQGGLKNVREIRETKKDIAKILTLLKNTN